MGRKLGQHFLKDKKVLAAIAREALTNTPAIVVEIGPGHGELTREVIKQLGNSVIGGDRIIAIEKDPELYAALVRNPEFEGKVRFIHGDVRKELPVLIAQLPNYPITIIGNIPFYLTGYLLRMLGDLTLHVRAVLLVQKEVAERAEATPPHMNLLAATLRGWATPKIAFTVPRGAFAPMPKVNSALLTLEPKEKIPQKELAHYFATAKKLFRYPRKTLANNLREGFLLTKERAEASVRALGLEENARAAELTPEHIKMLIKMVYN